MSVTEIELEVVRLHPAHAVHIGAGPAAALTASAAVSIGGARVLLGWALREPTGGAGASLRLRDGSNVQNEVLAPIDLAGNETVRDWFGPNGILISTGQVFAELIAGQVEGVLYVADLAHNRRPRP